MSNQFLPSFSGTSEEAPKVGLRPILGRKQEHTALEYGLFSRQLPLFVFPCFSRWHYESRILDLFTA